MFDIFPTVLVLKMYMKELRERIKELEQVRLGTAPPQKLALHHRPIRNPSYAEYFDLLYLWRGQEAKINEEIKKFIANLPKMKDVEIY